MLSKNIIGCFGMSPTLSVVTTISRAVSRRLRSVEGSDGCRLENIFQGRGSMRGNSIRLLSQKPSEGNRLIPRPREVFSVFTVGACLSLDPRERAFSGFGINAGSITVRSGGVVSFG